MARPTSTHPDLDRVSELTETTIGIARRYSASASTPSGRLHGGNVASELEAVMSTPTGRNSDCVELLLAFHAAHPGASGTLCTNALDLMERFSDIAAQAAVAGAWEQSADSQRAWANCVEAIRLLLGFAEASGDDYVGRAP